MKYFEVLFSEPKLSEDMIARTLEVPEGRSLLVKSMTEFFSELFKFSRNKEAEELFMQS